MLKLSASFLIGLIASLIVFQACFSFVSPRNEGVKCFSAWSALMSRTFFVDQSHPFDLENDFETQDAEEKESENSEEKEERDSKEDDKSLGQYRVGFSKQSTESPKKQIHFLAQGPRALFFEVVVPPPDFQA